MNVPNYQWKDIISDEIWDIHIPEGLFVNLDKHISATLVDKWFDPTTQAYIIENIGNVYVQGLLGEKGEIQQMFYEHSRRGGEGGVLPPTLNSMVLEGIDIGKIFKPWKYRESKNM